MKKCAKCKLPFPPKSFEGSWGQITYVCKSCRARATETNRDWKRHMANKLKKAAKPRSNPMCPQVGTMAVPVTPGPVYAFPLAHYLRVPHALIFALKNQQLGKVAEHLAELPRLRPSERQAVIQCVRDANAEMGGRFEKVLGLFMGVVA